MIELINVSLKFPTFEFNNINLKINPGEIVAITGSNASGKTTLLSIISGFIKPKGKVLIGGEKWSKTVKKIGTVYQNPNTQLIFNNVYDDISFTLKSFGIAKNEFDERIDSALALVDMTKFKHSEILNMSMGQKQRIAIANMLAINPDILLFDECTAYLDTNTKQIIYNLFQELKSKGVTVIFSTNMIDEIVYADKTIILNNGKLEKFTETKEILKNTSILQNYGIKVPLKLQIIDKFKLYDKKSDNDIIDALMEKK